MATITEVKPTETKHEAAALTNDEILECVNG